MSSALKDFLRQFALVRATAAMVRKRRAAAELARARRPGTYEPMIAEYLGREQQPRLQIGSGPHFFPGWLNTDYFPVSREFVFMDATKQFPLPSDTFELSFSEHIIEHIPYEGGENMLRETFRVLKPGGVVRVATPDLTKFIGLFKPQHTQLEKDYMKWAVDTYYPEVKLYMPGFVLNNFVRNWGHLFIYDPDTLKITLERAGFVDVRQCEPGESQVAGLRGAEHHGKMIGDDFNRFETLVMEGRKP
jgi:predicted SAM-dependent methyltransferase